MSERLSLHPTTDAPPAPVEPSLAAASAAVLRRRMTEQGLTLEALATRLEVPVKQVAARRAGQGWTWTDLERLPRALRMSVPEWLAAVAIEMRATTPEGCDSLAFGRAAGRALRRWRLLANRTMREVADHWGLLIEEYALREDGKGWRAEDLPWVSAVYHTPPSTFLLAVSEELDKGEDE